MPKFVDRHTVDHLIKMMIVPTKTTSLDDRVRDNLESLLSIDTFSDVHNKLNEIYNQCKQDRSLCCDFILEAMETLHHRMKETIDEGLEV